MTGDSEVPFWVEGRPKPATEQEMPFALFYLVTQEYHKVMKIPVERGRSFTERDDEHAPVVVIIDDTFARKYFSNEDPIGKRLNLGFLDMQPEIVGVVGHVEHWGLGAKGHENLQAQIYLPVWQIPDKFWPLLANGGQYAARTAGMPLGLTNSIREAAQRVDSSAVMYEVRPMQDIVAGSVATQRLAMILLSVFSALALLLSSIGIYGVISYLTGQRTHEIGVRMALGATSADVLRLVLGEGMRITLVGVGIGDCGRAGIDAADYKNDLRGWGNGSDHFRSSRDSADGRGPFGVLHSRTPRYASGPDCCLTLRIAGLLEPSFSDREVRRVLRMASNTLRDLAACDFAKASVGHIINEATHRDFLGNPGMRAQLLQLMAHILFNVLEGIKERGRDGRGSRAVLDPVAQIVFGGVHQAAIGVVDDHELFGVQQVMRYDQGAQGVFCDDAAGVSNDVGVAGL